MLTLFWTCAILVVVAQLMILRSTSRAQRGAGAADGTGTAPRNGPLEWAFAIVPALALVALLVLTWRAAT